MKRISSAWISAFVVLGFLLQTGSAFSIEPPKIPGKIYVKTPDGCGRLVDDAHATPSTLSLVSNQYWIGECRYGLANGFGYFWDPSNIPVMPAYMQFGGQQVTRAINSPSVGVWEMGSGSTINLSLFDESKEFLNSVSLPAHWNINDAFKPFYPTNNGSGFDDFFLSHTENTPIRNQSAISRQTSVVVSMSYRSCLIAGKKIPGCGAVYYQNFDVFGVHVNKWVGTDSTESFTLCPDPKTPVGCDATWREVAGPYIEKIVHFVKQAQTVMAAEQEAFAKASIAAEAALPADWKSHWKANSVDRSAVDMAQKCRQLSDFHPINLADAFYIKQKYTTAPCNAAITAAYAVTQAGNFIAYDSKGKDQEAAIRESYAQAKALRDAETAEAWSGFFNTTSAMLSANLQIQQQRIDNTNAPIADTSQQAAAAPAYQSYGQPAASSPQSYDPSKVQTRKIHKPELDAASCVKRAALASGDPLSSFGSQVFSNQCGQTVEVFWCKIGDECERGAGGSTTLGSGRSWPVTSGDYYYGACYGANSGALVRDASGVHTDRYACTGP